MAVERGIVTEVSADAAWVKTSRSASCEGCTSKGSFMSQGTDMVVKTINTANARVGDRVVVSLKTGAFLRATFLIYLFPILCLVTGAIIGHAAGSRLGLNPSALSAAAGFACLAAAVMVVKRTAGRMSADDAYQPRIVRIIGHDFPVPETRDPVM